MDALTTTTRQVAAERDRLLDVLLAPAPDGRLVLEAPELEAVLAAIEDRLEVAPAQELPLLRAGRRAVTGELARVLAGA